VDACAIRPVVLDDVLCVLYGKCRDSALCRDLSGLTEFMAPYQLLSLQAASRSFRKGPCNLVPQGSSPSELVPDHLT